MTKTDAQTLADMLAAVLTDGDVRRDKSILADALDEAGDPRGAEVRAMDWDVRLFKSWMAPHPRYWEAVAKLESGASWDAVLKELRMRHKAPIFAEGDKTAQRLLDSVLSKQLRELLTSECVGCNGVSWPKRLKVDPGASESDRCRKCRGWGWLFDHAQTAIPVTPPR